MKKKGKGSGFWNIADSLEGDKVIWMIVLLLIMLSILAISASTPLLAIQTHTTRDAIIREQLFIVGLGVLIIIGLYNVKNIGIFRLISQAGFVLSIGALLFLKLKLNLGFIRAVTINGATRAISIFGFQLHVFEFVKIMMIMYLAWAISALKMDDLPLANNLSKINRLGFLARKPWKEFLYIYLPIGSVCLLILNGSVSSTLFIGGILFITVLVGGLKVKTVIPYAIGAVIIFGLCIGLYYASDGKMFGRIGTAVGRVTRHSENPEEMLLKYPRNTKEFSEALDEARQPISAKVAISEGGVLGKGVGRSTQKYIVPIMFEDYMFSFIVEEYGLWGALLILALYASLVARGSIIVRNCDNNFAKVAVAGLVLLISLQAFMHIMINADMGPLTGQTLPMISHGNSSFLAFSMAFGIILSISRMAKKKIEKESDNAAPIIEQTDEVKDTLSELDQLENI